MQLIITHTHTCYLQTKLCTTEQLFTPPADPAFDETTMRPGTRDNINHNIIVSAWKTSVTTGTKHSSPDYASHWLHLNSNNALTCTVQTINHVTSQLYQHKCCKKTSHWVGYRCALRSGDTRTVVCTATKWRSPDHNVSDRCRRQQHVLLDGTELILTTARNLQTHVARKCSQERSGSPTSDQASFIRRQK